MKCATRDQLEEIESMVRRIAVHLHNENDLGMAHQLLGEAKEILGAVIQVKRAL